MVLHKIQFYENKEEFLKNHYFSHQLIAKTSSWSTKKFFGSFLYNHIITKMEQQDWKLTAFDWEGIFQFALHPFYGVTVFEILERNTFHKFSSPKDIVKGAFNSFLRWGIVPPVEEPFSQRYNVVKLLEFLKIDSISINRLVPSTFSSLMIEEDKEKIIEFFKKL